MSMYPANAGHQGPDGETSRDLEAIPTSFERDGRGSVSGTPGDGQRAAMHGLQAILEHRAVDFGQDVLTNVNLQGVGADTQDVAIERRMMNLAQGDPVGDLRLAATSILKDVSGIQQLRVAQ